MEQNKSGTMTKLKGFLNDGSLLLVIVILCMYFSVKSPYFFSFKNMMNMLISVSVIGIAATGFTCTLIARGPDLTTGAMMALSSCMAALLVSHYDMVWYGAVLVALGTGALFGLANGLLITKFQIAPIVVTLGMMSVVRGIAFIFTNGITIFITEPHLKWFGSGKIFGINAAVIIMILCFLLLSFVTRNTIFGRKIYACGSNPAASRLAGIKVNGIVTVLFTLSGFLSALAGLVLATGRDQFGGSSVCCGYL